MLESSSNTVSDIISGVHSNTIKDYIFPVAMALFSAFLSAVLGTCAAFYAVNIQEKRRTHIQNVDSINETILTAMAARSSLMAIKFNYHNIITSDPIERMNTVPYILTEYKPLQFDITKLTFLIPSDISQLKNNWRNIESISNLFHNYNQVLFQWQKRNELKLEAMRKMHDANDDILSEETLLMTIGYSQAAELSDLTEKVLMLTDEVLVEISCFLIGFPTECKKNIPIEIRKEHRKIITVIPSTNDMAVNLLSMSPELDFVKAAKLQGSTVQEVKERYGKIYP